MSENTCGSYRTYEKEWFISILRLLSTAAIVLCHILQFYGNVLAWWFNVGVQLFFLISGYLHANMRQKSMTSFMKRKLLNLLPDYYIYGLVVIVGYSIVLTVSDGITEFVKMFFITGSTSLSSLAHFWFLPYILFCYLMTPWFIDYLDDLNQRGGIVCLLKTILLTGIVELCCVFRFGFEPAWINCYLFGIIVYKFKTLNARSGKLITCGVFGIMLMLNAVQIWIDYFEDIHFEGVLASAYDELCHYGHVFLALGIFIIVMRIFSKRKISNSLTKLFDISDKYSYDIFLVHPVFVWSGISPLRLISSPWVATIVLFFEIAISTLILHRCAALFRKQFAKLKLLK